MQRDQLATHIAVIKKKTLGEISHAAIAVFSQGRRF
jgi:hypothetical protein